MKILFQDLCQDKADWDDSLPESLCQRWKKWCEELKKVGSIEIPRCYPSEITGGSTSFLLHGFCDSSQTSYAAVVYLRIETENEACTSLVASKTRVHGSAV